MMKTPKVKQKSCGRTIEQHCALKGLDMKTWLEKNHIDSFKKLYEVCEKMRLDVCTSACSLIRVNETTTIQCSDYQDSLHEVADAREVSHDGLLHDKVHVDLQNSRPAKTTKYKKKQVDHVNLLNDLGETTQEQYFESAPDISRS